MTFHPLRNSESHSNRHPKERTSNAGGPNFYAAFVAGNSRAPGRLDCLDCDPRRRDSRTPGILQEQERVLPWPLAEKILLSLYLRILLQSLRRSDLSGDHAVQIAIPRLARIPCFVIRADLDGESLYECLCARPARYPSRTNRAQVKGPGPSVETRRATLRTGRVTSHRERLFNMCGALE